MRYNLISKLPVELGDSTSLQRLDVSNNHLGDLPNELTRLKGLTHLICNGNNLSHIVHVESQRPLEEFMQYLSKRSKQLNKSTASIK